MYLQPFQAEHKSYEKQLSDSASDQDDKDQNIDQTLINPSAQGLQRFDYFSRTKETATFRITALSLASANAAAAKLQKCYHENVKTPSYDTQHLERWDNLQRNSLLSACKQVHVDVTLNYNLNRIELRGFLSDLDRIRTHEIIKEAEQDVHEKQHALLMSKQVQWSRIDVDWTGDVLTPYDPLTNYRIEMAYINKDPNKMLGATYIDFAKWKELPETPGDPNHPPVSVHRHSITEEMAFENPQHWKGMGKNELDLVPLQENNPEYEKVETAFRESVKQPSTKIVRVRLHPMLIAFFLQ
ncbi:hypothetical protein V1264_024450 [Littorina saxatilis]|uniref:Uncharacterized protein n=1 Tax=Littorina saxatilis TaxID=31220 RepID=A0AAN9AMN3_9CAEN